MGSLLSFAMTHAILALVGVSHDSMTLLSIMAVLVLTFIVGTMAALRPAVASASVDPIHALREE